MDDRQRLNAFHQGQCIDAYRFFGAHFCVENHHRGVRFTVYAPHAVRVWVTGSFTQWDKNKLEMFRSDDNGIWQLFVPDLDEWESYRFLIEDFRGNILYKSDPYAFYSETRPSSASKLFDIDQLTWSDRWWMRERNENFDQPMNIYEVYAGGWKKNGEYFYTYQDLQRELIPYVKEM